MSEATKPLASASPWSPLGQRAFALLWCATVLSNVGTWMHDVGAGWLMTELSPSPVIVTAVQAATTLPVFLFALLAGAVADIVDRRRLLLVANIFMAVTASLLAVLVAFGLMTPLLLLAFTFLLGTGAAFMAPAWQAIVPSLVPREQLSAAIALNSTGINVSRALGPAVAGFLIVAVGLWSPFALNALSFIGIITALLWWRPEAEAERRLPPEKIGSAMVAGLRFALNSNPLKATLIRAAAFFLFASAMWALLPLVTREVLNGGPTLYGVLLTSIGAGAVAGAFIMPGIKARFGVNQTVAAGTIGIALVLVIFATVKEQAAAIAAAALAGTCWIAVLSSLNLSAQTSLPNWVRARGLSVFLTVFFGAMSLGSLVWGQVAALTSIEMSLIIAAGGAIAAILLTWRAKLNQGEGQDFAPSMHWPALVGLDGGDEDRGPVMIQVAYSVSTENRSRFNELMNELADARRRNGGYDWSLMQDAAHPDRFFETWFEGSWIAHMRHHERITGADKTIQTEVLKLQKDNQDPVVTHLLAAPLFGES